MTRTNPLDVIRRRYDEFAPTYVGTWQKLEGYSDLVREFVGTIAPDARVLDLGCGPGHFTAQMPATNEVVGLDLSPLMLAQAAVARPSGVWIEHDYYEPVPERAGTFDAAVAVGALDFCEDIELVLRHLRAVVRPNARVLASFIERRAGVRGHTDARLPITPERMPGVDLVFYTLGEMAQAFERAGFVANAYRHRKGYRNQYHELDIGYAFWEISPS